MSEYVKDKNEYERMVKNARRADLWRFLHEQYPDSFVQEGSDWLRMKADRSVIIRCDWGGATDTSGKRGRSGGLNAIEVLTELLGYSFIDAVRTLQQYSRSGAAVSAISLPKSFNRSMEKRNEVKENLLMPSPVSDPNRVLHNYLCNDRGLDSNVVKSVMTSGLAYLANARNVFSVSGLVAVFVNAVKTFATARAVTPMANGARYRTYASDKSSFWHWKPKPDAKAINAYICEGVIDALSLYSLLSPEIAEKSVYCAVGGVQMYPRIEYVIMVCEKGDICPVMATDADDAGDGCAKRYAEKTQRLRPPNGAKDWNDALRNGLAL